MYKTFLFSEEGLRNETKVLNYFLSNPLKRQRSNQFRKGD